MQRVAYLCFWVLIKSTTMATVNYQLIGNSIYLTLSASNQNRESKTYRRKTGLSTKPNLWQTKKSRSKTDKGKYRRIPNLDKPTDAESKKTKEQLEELSGKIISDYNTDYVSGITIDGNWLKAKILKHTNQSNDKEQYLVYQIEKLIEEAPYKKIRIKGGGYKVGLTKGSIKVMRSFKNNFIRFQDEAHDGNKIKVTNVTPELVNEFEEWLNKKRYAKNYVGRMLSNLKSALNDIADKGIKINLNTKKDIKVIREPKNPEDIIYLSFEELEIIKETELPTNYLKNARKWLILGCYVGQRASDLLRLSERKITILRGKRVFKIKQKKTGSNVTIPILPEAERIIKSGFPHPISATKLREYFKQICRLAGIDDSTNGRIKKSKHGKTIKGVYPKWRLIGTHVCRRSFASNFYGTMPTPILISITGHSTEEMFLRYIGKEQDDLALQMFDYVDKLPKVKTLKVVNKKTGTDK